MAQIITKHNGGMGFSSNIDGHTITIDSETKFGGDDAGPTPKPLLLLSLSGCTGMDVVSLLKKMRVKYADFQITVDGELTDEHPRYYHKINLTYSIKTKPEHHKNIKKAVDLSQERYCGVSYMLSKSSELTYEIDFQEL
jgi:putative redox protein